MNRVPWGGKTCPGTRGSVSLFGAIMSKIALIVGLLAVAAGIVWFLLSTVREPDTELTAPVRRGDFLVTVQAKGRLESDGASRVEARGRGSVLTYLAPEGTTAKKDDVLARFDDTALRERLLANEYDLKLAEVRLAERREQAAVTASELDAQERMLEADLAIRRTQYERLKARPLPDEVLRSRLERDYRRSRLDLARQDYETLRDLAAKGSAVFSKDEMREKEMAFAEAKGEAEKAENDLAEVQSGAPPAELDAAKRELAKAEIDLADARRRRPERATMLEADVRAGEAEVDKMKARLDNTQKDLDKLEVKATADGVVLYRTVNNRPLELGAQFWHVAHLFDIANLDRMVVRAKVSESEFACLKPGQPVEVRARTVPDRVFAGEVSEVAQVARDKSEGEMRRSGSGPAGQQTFDVVVRLRDAHEFLRPNVEADLTIICVRMDDALSVPVDAVFSDGARTCVRVLDGAHARLREVTLGVRSTDRAQVLKGLEAGERVLLRPPRKEGD